MKIFSQYSSHDSVNIQSMISSGLRMIPNGKVVLITNNGDKTFADAGGNLVERGVGLQVPDGGYFHFGVERFQVTMS